VTAGDGEFMPEKVAEIIAINFISDWPTIERMFNNQNEKLYEK